MRYNPAVSKARDALKMWTGWPTFPMIFVDQKLVGGSKDLRAYLEKGLDG